MEEKIQKSHKLVMNNRKNIALTGVIDVISFDVNEVILETELGLLTIKGDNLHVNRIALDKGEADITGKADGLSYSDSGTYKKENESVLSRLFK